MRITQFLEELGHDIVKKDFFDFASLIAFKSVFSMFPLFFFLASIMGYVGEEYHFYAKMMEVLERVMPIEIFGLVADNIRDALPFKSSIISILALMVALLVGTNVIRVVIKVINHINNIKDRRSIVRKRVLSVIFLIVFTLNGQLAISMIVFMKYFFYKWFPIFLRLPKIDLTIQTAEVLIYFIILLLCSAVFYYDAIAVKVRFAHTLVGSAFFCMSFSVFCWLAKIGFKYVTTLNVTYGAITGIIFLLLWLQFIAFFLLIGSRIACKLQEMESKIYL